MPSETPEDNADQAYPLTPRNQVRRIAQRGAYDDATVHAIIDRAWFGHVAIRDGDGVVSIPMLHGRDGRSLLFHGARASRLLQQIAGGAEVCVSFAEVNGLVLAKSLFHHSMNYRSAVAFGRGHEIADASEKLEALRIITERLVPGRWDDARTPTEKELNATLVVRTPIESASAKIREGGPKDEAEDLALPFWTGVLPLTERREPPQPADDSGAEPPGYIATWLAGS